MKAEIIKKGKKSYLQVTMPIEKRVSKSGKSMIVASTNGNKPTGVEIKGQEVILGFNAYIPNNEEE